MIAVFSSTWEATYPFKMCHETARPCVTEGVVVSLDVLVESVVLKFTNGVLGNLCHMWLRVKTEEKENYCIIISVIVVSC